MSSCSTPVPGCARSAPRSVRRAGSELHILLTHLHLDHLQGLGFFQPLFQPGADVHIWGPPSPVQTLAERIAIYLSPPLFPVRLSDVPASVTFHDADEDGVTIGSAVIRAGRVTHQGPTVGYRIEEGEPVARLPPRPRAGPRREPRGAAGSLDERLRHRARRRRAVPRRAVPRRGVSGTTSAGGTARSATRSSSRGGLG